MSGADDDAQGLLELELQRLDEVDPAMKNLRVRRENLKVIKKVNKKLRKAT